MSPVDLSTTPEMIRVLAPRGQGGAWMRDLCRIRNICVCTCTRYSGKPAENCPICKGLGATARP